MVVHEDSLKSLTCLLGWSGRMANLEDKLADIHHDHDHWCRRAKEAETVSAILRQQEAATFKQACLLSMYIPSARPEDAPGAGPSSQPLEECLISPGGGSGVPHASSHSGEPHSHSSHPQSLGTIFGKMNVNEPTTPPPPGSSLAGQLKEVEETMFPLLGWGEFPNRVSVLLDGTRYLHVQVGNSLYQFKSPARESIIRNIGARVPPPLTGANPPGTVCLFNTVDKLNELYTRVAQESDERDLPNTRMGQRLMAWLNSKMMKKFLGIWVETDPGFVEPPSDQRLRGFILKGYFAPRFQYDSNHNGWHRNFMQLFTVPGQYQVIVKQEGWVIVPGCSSQWTEAVDRAPSPLAIAGYLTRNGLSFQEADDLYEWVAAVLHKDTMGQEANVDITSDLLVAGTTIEGPEWSLEYYEERAEQGGSQLKFRDIKSLPGDTLSLLRVEEAARYLPTPPQKKKHHSHRKTMDTDKEDSYSSFSEDSLGSDDGGPPWNPPKDDQMDIDNSGPLQM
ncbi:hypothetical protein SCLCIDRAFT_24437 [Scleroderma citrinum Foug A]|uniref:Uncharacterized protein n=1 Tax=Scleroderma citrinum Foug A TaxID=1036808 RepID=A0A0C3AEC7_9AGAM|nr:hypothetical protein SCLCIDRAFT_24437 [Scleroderma citrinum Foug A]